MLPKNYAKNISKLQHFLTNNPMVMTQLLKILGENINEKKYKTYKDTKKQVEKQEETLRLYTLYKYAQKMKPGPRKQRAKKEIDKLRKKLGKKVINLSKVVHWDTFNEIAVRKTPKKFKDIFNTLPSDLRKRVYNLKKYDQRRDKHPEGNVLKHTIAVTNRALKTGDIDFALAALFHDIGKDETAGIHPKHGYITHWGHEHVSAKLVKKYGKWIKSMGGNVLDIYWIVKQHMRMKVFDKMRWEKQEKMKKFRAFGKLKKFSKDFDKGGRR
jgi:putative nucleotidyltransferase with HDIG domain